MPKENLYAVILAGGAGTRFWPLSRSKKPKQFLDIAGQGSLLQETLARIKPKVPGSRVYIVTGAMYRRQVARQTRKFNVPASNILSEPSGKNTAPAVGWAAALIHKKNPDAVLTVLPSDHLILHRAKFLNVLSKAVRLAEHNYLVTLGIKPTRPETGYGYLRTRWKNKGGKAVLVVDKFTEKPAYAVAKRFVNQHNYFWNSGMFAWKASVILDEFKTHLPKIYKHLSQGASPAYIKKIWRYFPSISIDYGILEKAAQVAAVPAVNIGWSDLGSWESLADVLAKKKGENIIRGHTFVKNSRGSLIWGADKFIAAIGLENLIVVDTPDALLICPKSRSQDVRDVVAHLKKHKRPEI